MALGNLCMALGNLLMALGNLLMTLNQLLLNLCQFGTESSRGLCELPVIAEASLIAGFRSDNSTFERLDMVADGRGESEGTPKLLERRTLLE